MKNLVENISDRFGLKIIPNLHQNSSTSLLLAPLFILKNNSLFMGILI